SVLPTRPLVSLSGNGAEESRRRSGDSAIVGNSTPRRAGSRPHAAMLARRRPTFARGGHRCRSGGTGGATSGANVGGMSAAGGAPGAGGNGGLFPGAGNSGG